MTTSRKPSSKRRTTSLFWGIPIAIAIAIAALAMGIATRYMFPFQGPCIEENGVIETVVGKVHPCQCYSETYIEARNKFRKAAQQAGAEMFQLDIYKNYTTDIAYFKGTTDDLVVHTSGVHGVEGYAGSAIQIAMLKSHYLSSSSSPRPSLLFLHAVNPYGMAHYRRPNENNVDLNRNGLHDFTHVLARDPNLAFYKEFDAYFNPTKPLNFEFFIGLVGKLLTHGMPKLKKAMVTGQYHKPTGLFYGGSTLEASNAKMYDFVKNFCDQNPVQGKITWIDVHTGLGTPGMDTILFESAINGDLSKEIAQVFRDANIPGISGGDDVASGYDLMTGSTAHLIQPLFPKESSWLVSQEFGTVPSLLVGFSLILENMMHHYQPDKKSNSWLLMSFYQRTADWRKSILEKGLILLKQSIER